MTKGTWNCHYMHTESGEKPLGYLASAGGLGWSGLGGGTGGGRRGSGKICRKKEIKKTYRPFYINLHWEADPVPQKKGVIFTMYIL